MTDVFWMRRRPNFGDAMAPLLVARFAGLEAHWVRPWLSDAVVIGSVVDRLPARYRGVVIGAGMLQQSSTISLASASVLGVRGELTRRATGVRGKVVLGDPGLLAAELLGDRPEQTHALGVVPHFKDLELAERYPSAFRVDVGAPPLEVFRAIASCERIISSSLHGLITADSLGIPRRWEPSAAMRGGRFKFDDYASALGITIEPDEWSSAPRSQVARVTADLRDAFAAMADAVRAAQLRRLRGYGRILERVPRSARPT